MLAMGITGYMYRQFLAQNIPAGPGTFPIDRHARAVANPHRSGQILFEAEALVYIMLMLTFVIHFVLFYTPWGLRTRAVGEHRRPPTRWASRYFASAISTSCSAV